MAALRHDLAEIGALEHFHGLEQHAVGFAHFEDADQVGMFETAAGLGFAREAFARFRRQVGDRHRLDRDFMAILGARAEQRLRAAVNDLRRSGMDRSYPSLPSSV